MAIDIRLKHSSVQDRAPLATDLVAGELAVNIHEDSAAIYFLDSAGNVRKMAGPATTNAPAAPVPGDTWVDIATNPATINIWDPTAGGGAGAWVPVAGGTVTGPGLTGIWDRVGTVISPTTDGDGLVLNDGTGTASVDLDAGASAAPLVRDATGRVGIGIATPQNNLHVSQSGASANYAQFTNSTTGNTSADGSLVGINTNSELVLWNYENAGIKFATSGAEVSRFEASGNLLLGGTLPGTPNISLNANGTASFKDYLVVDRNAPNESAIEVTRGGTKAIDLRSNGSAEFTGTVLVGAYNGTSTATNGARITASGLLTLQRQSGAATDNRFEILDGTTVKAGITNNGSATFASDVQSGGDPRQTAETGARLISGGGIYCRRSTGNLPVFRGYVQGSSTITTEINADGSAKLEGTLTVGNPYVSSAAAPGISAAPTGQIYLSGTGGDAIRVKNSAGGGAGTNTVQIFHDGTATFTGNVTAPNVTSDIRFKENIAPASSQLNDVKQLSALLKNWDWNDQAPMNDEIRSQRFLGLVAQEAEKVCPCITYTVQRTKQGKELTPEQVIPAVYEDRPDPEDEENFIQVEVTPEQVIPATYEELDDSYKALKHDVILMKLLGTVGELIAKNEALEAKVTAMEGGAPAKTRR